MSRLNLKGSPRLRISILILLSFLISLKAKATFVEKQKLDSLKAVIALGKKDTNEVAALNSLAFMIHKYLPDSALNLGKKAIELADQLHYTSGQAASLRNMAIYLRKAGQKEASFKTLEKGLAISEKNHLKKLEADCISDRGLYKAYDADFTGAMEDILKGLKIYEELNYKTGIAKSYLNMGLVLEKENEMQKALDCFHKALAISLSTRVAGDLSSSYSNIGILHMLYTQHYDSALIYMKRSYQIQKNVQDILGSAETLVNIGTLYETIGKNDSAMACYMEGYRIGLRSDNKRIIGGAMGNIGSIHQAAGRNQLAHKAYDSSALTLRQSGTLDLLAELYYINSQLYEGEGKINEAYRFYKYHVHLKDTLYNQQKSKQMAEMETKYETAEKEKQIALLNKDKEVQEKLNAGERKKQKIILVSVSSILLVLAVFFIFLYKSYIQKQKTNAIILQQKEEVERKNDIIEEKNKDIMDSIQYASRIQRSLMPTEKYIEKQIRKES